MSTYVYILVAALTTYLIRMIPLVFFRKPIKNRFLKSFLTYVPSACLATMTFPGILYSTNSLISGSAALLCALILAYFKRSLATVAAASCVVVFVTELILRMV